MAVSVFGSQFLCAAERMPLDGSWDFAFEEKATLASARADFKASGTMVVPGCFDLMPEWYARRGLAHYRRVFSLSAPVANAWLVVKGMGLQARFFLDGREIAESKLPYSTLEIPLGALVAGETGCYSLYGCHDPMGAQWSEEFQSEYLDFWLKAAMASPDISGFAAWQFCDTRTFFRGGGDIRTKPMGYNMAGLFDAHRRPKLAASTVRRHYNRERMEK